MSSIRSQWWHFKYENLILNQQHTLISIHLFQTKCIDNQAGTEFYKFTIYSLILKLQQEHTPLSSPPVIPPPVQRVNNANL